MARRQTISASCPYCRAAMRTSAMRCPSCDIEVRGVFRLGLFSLLSDEDQLLLEQYLLAGFSIRQLEKDSGMGYAAIRTRLDRLIEAYARLRRNEDARKGILERVARGELTAAEAAARLRDAENGHG